MSEFDPFESQGGGDGAGEGDSPHSELWGIHAAMLYDVAGMLSQRPMEYSQRAGPAYENEFVPRANAPRTKTHVITPAGAGVIIFRDSASPGLIELTRPKQVVEGTERTALALSLYPTEGGVAVEDTNDHSVSLSIIFGLCLQLGGRGTVIVDNATYNTIVRSNSDLPVSPYEQDIARDVIKRNRKIQHEVPKTRRKKLAILGVAACATLVAIGAAFASSQSGEAPAPQPSISAQPNAGETSPLTPIEQQRGGTLHLALNEQQPVPSPSAEDEALGSSRSVMLNAAATVLDSMAQNSDKVGFDTGTPEHPLAYAYFGQERDNGAISDTVSGFANIDPDQGTLEVSVSNGPDGTSSLRVRVTLNQDNPALQETKKGKPTIQGLLTALNTGTEANSLVSVTANFTSPEGNTMGDFTAYAGGRPTKVASDATHALSSAEALAALTDTAQDLADAIGTSK
jgi:hypothetical protein